MSLQTREDVPSLEREAEELRARNQRLHRELIQRSHDIWELELKASERESEFVTSLSWRLTAPLRRLMAAIRKLLRG